MQRFALVRWLAILSLMTAACGKKAEDEPVHEAAATAARDACTLLNEQDVAAVHGAPVTAKRESRGADYSSCEFTDPAKQDYFVMGIEVYRFVHEMQQDETGEHVATSMLKGVHIDTVARRS